MNDLIILSLALWIVTHTISQEIPLTAAAPKPFSCQLCLSGWMCIAIGLLSWLQSGKAYQLPQALAAWALAVLVEAIYQRMRVIIL